jgi:putative ABC transport system substrate-binding protein
MNHRRKLIVSFGAGLLAASLPNFEARAQQFKKPRRVGVLWHAASAAEEGPYFDAVIQGFKELGYVDGQNIVLDHRFPNEEPEKFRSMAAEHVALRPEVILAAGGPASIAAKNATTSIPVVFAVVPDPVGNKLVDSLAKPGGNITGLTNFGVQLIAKRMEYLKEAIPRLSRVAVLVNPNAQSSRQSFEDSQAAAEKLQLTIQRFEAQTLADLESIFDAMIKARMQAVSLTPDGLFFQFRTVIGRLMLARRLPSCVYSREILEAGALLSYGADQRAIFRRSTVYVDKILKGARPADIPVEQPARFEMIVNMKTAKALDIKIPQSISVRADMVIE